MVAPRPVGSLEIFEDLEFQRRSWIVQRIAWSVMAALVLAAAAGLFGSGPLSHARASSADGSLRIDYARFARYQGPARLKIQTGGGLARDGAVRISLNREYLDGITIKQVTPFPDRIDAVAGGVVFVIRGAEPEAAVTVHIDYEPARVGRLRGYLAAGDAPGLRFGQFVYP
jgi:hypothetical protein